MSDFTRSAADTFFGSANHTLSHVWDRFTANDKEAALAQAKRDLSRFLREDIENATIQASTYHRPDYAVFEQAMYILVQAGMPDGDLNAPSYLAKAPLDLEAEDGLYIEALRWLPLYDRPAQIVRG